jgi:hypothetical protein
MDGNLMPLVVMLSLRDDDTERTSVLTEAIVAASPAIPPGPRLVLAVQNARNHADEVTGIQKARVDQVDRTATEFHELLKAENVKLPQASVDRTFEIKNLIGRLQARDPNLVKDIVT